MEILKLVPAFRIEIRAADADDNAPWIVAELAHGSSHVDAKLPRWRSVPGLDSRAVANLPAPATVATASTAEMTTPLTVPPAIVATAPAVVAPQLPASTDAAAGATPLPFDVGSILRDAHTGARVRVLEINPVWGQTQKVRAGFKFECEAFPIDHPNRIGFCPLQSVGCFEIVPTNAPATVADTAKAAAPAARKHAAPAKAAAKPAARRRHR